mgnify:CR=1 FL=1
MKYKIVNLLNGAVTLVIANSFLQAMRAGQDYFTEPNRPVANVQILGTVKD